MGLILSLLLVAVATWVGTAYNRLVALRRRCRDAFAQIDVDLARRHDLVPRLVEAARGPLAHERETLEAVMQALAAAVGARDTAATAPVGTGSGEMHGRAGAEARLDGALGRLTALVGACPGLTADPTLAPLSEALAGAEHRIASARQAYDDVVADYNARVERFPVNLVANAFGFARAEPFSTPSSAAQRQAPPARS